MNMNDYRDFRGLSPRVRGNQRRLSYQRAKAAVYPRVCGGTQSSLSSPQAGAGLSPRVRGNRRGPSRRSEGKRSIPACAGEPAVSAGRARGSAVYPRVCGGTWRGLPLCPSCEGLSPRVRGNQGGGESRLRRKGSIPACAGEPLHQLPHRRSRRVYPRVCGGTPSASTAARTPRGLSPRVRGNPGGQASAGSAYGSIPACAGEPLAVTRGAGAPRARGLSPRVRGNPPVPAA